jgi:hypothetical protein
MYKNFYPIILFFMLMSGCAGTGGGLGAISKTNSLVPGMTPKDVKAVLGDPSQTSFVGNKWIWKYSLHEYGKGWVPHYLTFSKNTKKLEAWYADEAEYRQQQELWLKALQPIQQGPKQVPKNQERPSSGDDCPSQYPVFEDRMCYCHGICN